MTTINVCVRRVDNLLCAQSLYRWVKLIVEAYLWLLVCKQIWQRQRLRSEHVV